jgi:hypothetical protein
MKRCGLCTLLVALAVPASLPAQDKTVTIAISADQDLKNAPVCIPLSLPRPWGKLTYAQLSGDGQNLQGQLTAPGITTEAVAPAAPELVRRDLHVVIPDLKRGASLNLTAKLFDFDRGPERNTFVWRSLEGGLLELMFFTNGGRQERPVLRYMNRAFDDSSKDARERTYKVFHHLYDAAGKRFVTNGGHTDLKPGETRKLLYPHHRGIMFGFNKCSYGPDLKNKADTWHCTGDAHVAHEKILVEEAGAVLGRRRMLVGWHGEKKERFAQEERELTVYDVPGGILVEFASRLSATGGPVRLDGDPQHAGFQFRASNDVADKTAKQTYYFHPDGQGAPGATRNWPQDKGMIDLPWYAMSFVLDNQRYTCCYLNHPHNPKESRFSERDYGRFGGYFMQDVTEKQPLVVNYRLWLQNGEMSPEQAAALHAAFAKPPRTNVK